MGEDEQGKTHVCERHGELAVDLKEIKDLVHEILLRLERGDSNLQRQNERIDDVKFALNRHIEEHRTYASKLIIGLLLSAVTALAVFVFANAERHQAQSQTSTQGKP